MSHRTNPTSASHSSSRIASVLISLLVFAQGTGSAVPGIQAPAAAAPDAPFTATELWSLHREYVQQAMGDMRDDAYSGNTFRYYFLSYYIHGLLSGAEATGDDYLARRAIELVDIAIGEARLQSQRTESGNIRRHLGWGPIEENGRGSELYTYQGAGAIARAAWVLHKRPSWRRAYQGEIQRYVDFVEDAVIQSWYVDRYGQTVPWLNFNNFSRWNDKTSHLGMMTTWLWQVTEDPKYRRIASQIGSAFKEYVTQSGGVVLWDVGNIRIGSDTNGEYGSVGNQAGVPDTSHANREPMMMMAMEEADIVFTRGDLLRLAHTFTDRIWRGTFDEPQFANYIDGSNKPYRTRYEPGSNGAIYLGWALVGNYMNWAQKCMLATVRAVRSGVNNPSIQINSSPYAKVELTGHVLRNMMFQSSKSGVPVLAGLKTDKVMSVDSVVGLEGAGAAHVDWQVVSMDSKNSKDEKDPKDSKKPGNSRVAGTAMARTYRAATIANAESVKTDQLGLSLASLGLTPGVYRIRAQGVSEEGVFSAPVEATINLVSGNLASVKVFPNPWRSNVHNGARITFDNLTANSTVKIFTLSGYLAKELSAPGSQVTWDLTNDSGDKVASGLYLYSISDDRDEHTRGKLAIIK